MLMGLNTTFVVPVALGWTTSPPTVAPYRQNTGLAPTVTLSKNGGAFANPHAGATTATDLGFGIYCVTLAPQDTDTLGSLVTLFSWAGGGLCWPSIDQVVTALPGDPGQLTVAERIAISNTLLQLPDGVELGLTPRDALKLTVAGNATKRQVGPGALVCRNFGDTKNRITFILDVPSQTWVVSYDLS